jgi:hypothetical protein
LKKNLSFDIETQTNQNNNNNSVGRRETRNRMELALPGVRAIKLYLFVAGAAAE